MVDITKYFGGEAAKPSGGKPQSRPISEALAIMSSAGLIVRGGLIEDGEIHRVPTKHKPKKDHGWYVVQTYTSGAKAVYFGDWGTGLSQAWASISNDKSWAVDHQERLEQIKIRDVERRRRLHEAGIKAAQTWAQGLDDDVVTPYLAKKKVGAHGVRAIGDNLLVPVYSMGGDLMSVQTIWPTGKKRFTKDGQVKNGLMLIGTDTVSVRRESVVAVCEGYATAMSVYETTGLPVAVIFSAHFAEGTLQELRQKTDARFILCLDQDDNGVGQGAAEKVAANLDNCVVRVPPEAGDWNDMHQKYGGDFVRRHILDKKFGLTGSKARYLTGVPPEQVWLAENYIEAGKAGVLAGVGGIGKSMEALRLAMMVVKGEGRWMGHNIKQSGNAVLICAEDDRIEMHRRVHSIDPEGERHEWLHDLYLHTVPDSGAPVTFMTGTGAGECQLTDAAVDLERELEEIEDLQLVIFDPVQAFTTAPISSSNEAGQMWAQFCTGLASRLGCVVLSIHHMSKVALTGNQSAAEARASIRGASSLVDGHRFAIALWNASDLEVADACLSIGELPDPTRVAKVSMVKANSGGVDRGVRLLIRRGSYFELVDDPDDVQGSPDRW